ncbi:NAD-glutamate dehydrogenase [Pseudomonas syringae]|nr:NAD-glutamate dehydrogenase [Pseudomonas syringae]
MLNHSLMSEGGGIFPRSLKSISITPQMKARFDIQADKLTPTELMHALLKAPVDPRCRTQSESGGVERFAGFESGMSSGMSLSSPA